MIRARRPAITLRMPAMPVSRKTGASASCMACVASPMFSAELSIGGSLGEEFAARVRPRVQEQPQDKSVLSLGETRTRRHSLRGSALWSTSRQLDPAKRRQISYVRDLPGQTWRAMGAQTRQRLED